MLLEKNFPGELAKGLKPLSEGKKLTTLEHQLLS